MSNAEQGIKNEEESPIVSEIFSATTQLLHLTILAFKSMCSELMFNM
jgi:hypothetical protein